MFIQVVRIGTSRLACLMAVVASTQVGGTGAPVFAQGPEFKLVSQQPAPGGSWDCLPDGRIITIVDDAILREVTPQ